MKTVPMTYYKIRPDENEKTDMSSFPGGKTQKCKFLFTDPIMMCYDIM